MKWVVGNGGEHRLWVAGNCIVVWFDETADAWSWLFEDVIATELCGPVGGIASLAYAKRVAIETTARWLEAQAGVLRGVGA
jgi:hypothetical protein